MSRGKYFGLALALCASAACTPASIDGAELRSAADARQRQAGVALLPAARAGAGDAREVKALLARPLSAEAAARIAVLNNPGLRADLEQLAAARSALRSAERLPNPTVEGAMRFHGSDDPELEIGAMIDVGELVLVLARGGAAQASFDAAKLAAIGRVVDQSFAARRAFIDYQTALQRLELRHTVLRALAASAEVAQRLRAAGNVTELALATEQSLYQEARLGLQRAEIAAASARERLNAAMGLWGEAAEWRAEARLPELPPREIAVERLEGDAVRRSLDLSIAEHRFAAAAKRANVLSATGWLPELKAGVSAERAESWAVGPAVEIEVPLFYQGQGEVGAARAEMRRFRHAHRDVAVRLRAAARDAAARLLAARDAVNYYRDVLLPLKQKILDETELQYNAMLVGVFQLLQAKRDQVETASAYIEQLGAYWLARTHAEQLLAGRLTGSLPAPSAAEPATESRGSAADGH